MKKLLFVAVTLAIIATSFTIALVAPTQEHQRVEADEHTTIFTPTEEPMPILTNELIPTSLYGMQNSIDDDDTVINESTTWSAGTYGYDSILITNDSVLTLYGSVTINCAHLTVESGSRISGDGTGYGSGSGPGAGGTCRDDWREYYCQYWGGGGGYSGNGGGYSCAGGGGTYGSLYEPIDLGQVVVMEAVLEVEL